MWQPGGSGTGRVTNGSQVGFGVGAAVGTGVGIGNAVKDGTEMGVISGIGVTVAVAAPRVGVAVAVNVGAADAVDEGAVGWGVPNAGREDSDALDGLGVDGLASHGSSQLAIGAGVGDGGGMRISAN
jgi:hypothetical protein